MKQLHIEYFALLREERGCRRETVRTDAISAADLYRELQTRHAFSAPADRLKVAINNEIRPWTSLLKEGDTVSFIPPVSGG